MASGAQIQFNTADQPVIQFNSADQAVGETKPSDPLGNLTPDEYSKLQPGEQQFRQTMGDFKKAHPNLYGIMESLALTPPGGIEMSIPGAVSTGGMAIPSMRSAARGIGEAADSPLGKMLLPYRWRMAAQVLSDWAGSSKEEIPQALNDLSQSLVGKQFSELNETEKQGIRDISGKLKPKASTPPSAPPIGSLNPLIDELEKARLAKSAPIAPAAEAMDISALPVKTPTEDQATKVIPFSKTQADPEVFAAKNRAPRVQKFADYLESNKVPISDLTQLSTDDPFWGQLGKAVGIKAPSKQTVMDTISELLKRQAMQLGGPLANNPAAMKAAMALRDAMNQ